MRPSDLDWKRDPGFSYSHFTAKLPDRSYFVVAVMHGGGWVALEYGPRGACKAAKDFWELPDRAGQARQWCEQRFRTRRKR